MLTPDRAYAEAKQELWLNYGQPHLITLEFDKKLKQFSDIRAGERSELKRYAELLETVHISLISLKRDGALDHPNYLVDIVSKLPMHDRRAWLRRAAKIREEKHEVKFSDVVKFVKTLSREANDSEFAVLLDSKKVRRRDAMTMSLVRTRRGTSTHSSLPMKLGTRGVQLTTSRRLQLDAGVNLHGLLGVIGQLRTNRLLVSQQIGLNLVIVLSAQEEHVTLSGTVVKLQGCKKASYTATL
jgi:hypothetical protein